MQGFGGSLFKNPCIKYRSAPASSGEAGLLKHRLELLLEVQPALPQVIAGVLARQAHRNIKAHHIILYFCFSECIR